jgi:hypothetical protein
MFGHKKSTEVLSPLSDAEKQKVEASLLEIEKFKKLKEDMQKTKAELDANLGKISRDISRIAIEVKELQIIRIRGLENLFDEKTSLNRVECTFDRLTNQLCISMPAKLGTEGLNLIQSFVAKEEILNVEKKDFMFGNDLHLIYVAAKAYQNLVDGLSLINLQPAKTAITMRKC